MKALAKFEDLANPIMVEDAMAHSQPYVASADHQADLGFPGELVDNWETKAVEKLGDLLDKNNDTCCFPCVAIQLESENVVSDNNGRMNLSRIYKRVYLSIILYVHFI